MKNNVVEHCVICGRRLCYGELQPCDDCWAYQQLQDENEREAEAEYWCRRWQEEKAAEEAVETFYTEVEE